MMSKCCQNDGNIRNYQKVLLQVNNAVYGLHTLTKHWDMYTHIMSAMVKNNP